MNDHEALIEATTIENLIPFGEVDFVDYTTLFALVKDQILIEAN